MSNDKWIMDKEIMVYIRNGILLSLKNEILPFGTIWMDLEGIILNEVSQAKTNSI